MALAPLGSHWQFGGTCSHRIRQQLQPRSGLGPCTAKKASTHQAPHDLQPYRPHGAGLRARREGSRLDAPATAGCSAIGQSATTSRTAPGTLTQGKPEQCYGHKHIKRPQKEGILMSTTPATRHARRAHQFHGRRCDLGWLGGPLGRAAHAGPRTLWRQRLGCHSRQEQGRVKADLQRPQAERFKANPTAPPSTTCRTPAAQSTLLSGMGRKKLRNRTKAENAEMAPIRRIAFTSSR